MEPVEGRRTCTRASQVVARMEAGGSQLQRTAFEGQCGGKLPKREVQGKVRDLADLEGAVRSGWVRRRPAQVISLAVSEGDLCSRREAYPPAPSN